MLDHVGNKLEIGLTLKMFIDIEGIFLAYKIIKRIALIIY